MPINYNNVTNTSLINHTLIQVRAVLPYVGLISTALYCLLVPNLTSFINKLIFSIEIPSITEFVKNTCKNLFSSTKVPNLTDLIVEKGSLVDKILNGTKESKILKLIAFSSVGLTVFMMQNVQQGQVIYYPDLAPVIESLVNFETRLHTVLQNLPYDNNWVTIQNELLDTVNTIYDA